MTLKELESSFQSWFGRYPSAAYAISANKHHFGERCKLALDHDLTHKLSAGVYLLLDTNDTTSFNFWSLNEPEIISIGMNEFLNTREDETWLRYPLHVFGHYLKQGLEFKTGYDIFIWGNIPEDSGMKTTDVLQLITVAALNDQLGVNLLPVFIESNNI